MSSKLSSLLVQEGVVSVKRMEEGFQRQVIFGGSLDTILLEMNAIDEATLMHYLYASSGLAPADLSSVDFGVARAHTKVFPKKLAEKYLIVPVLQAEGVLHVLVTDPPDQSRLDELGFMLGTTLVPRIVPEFRLYQALELIYDVKMPLRYSGLAKRFGNAPKPDPADVADAVPVDGVAAQPAMAMDEDQAVETAEPSIGATYNQPLATAEETGEPQEWFEPLEESPAPEPPPTQVINGETAWDDPLAGAKPATLVGIPIHDPVGLPPRAEAAAGSGEIDVSPAPKPYTLVGMPLEGPPAVADHEEGELPPPGDKSVGAEDAEPAIKATVMGMPQVDLAALQVPARPPESAQPAATGLVAETPEPVTATPASALEPQPFDPTPIDFEVAVEQLGEAFDRDGILEIFLRCIAGYFESVAIFTVFGEQAVGRMAINRGRADTTRIAGVSVPLTIPSIFKSTVDSRGYYFGPVYDEGINFGVLADMERPVPASAFILPVLIRNRVVCFLYADDGLRPVDVNLPESLVIISYQVSQAFQRLILQAKRGQYSGASQQPEAVGKVEKAGHDVTFKQRAPSADAWQTPAMSGPATTRAPQVDGALVESLAPPASASPAPTPRPTVQPAFPALPRGQAGPVSQPAGPPVGPELEYGEAADTWVDGPPDLHPHRESGRAITSVGYYSLTESGIRDDLSGVSGAKPPEEPSPYQGQASGEFVTQGPTGTPSSALADDRAGPRTPTRQRAPAEERSASTEDIWGLIDELERGGEMGDLAAAALQRLGDPALKLVAFRFPGRLHRSRVGDRGQLPPPSEHGPLLHFLVHVGKPAVKHLLLLLGAENPEVRYYATFIFTELRIPQALPHLLERLFDSATPIRRVAIEVMKVYQGTAELTQVLEHLRAELTSPTALRRRYAAEALGALRDVHGVPRLVELTADRDTDVAEAAQRALLLITKQAFGDSRRKWRTWWERNRDRHRLQWLIDALSHKESECRYLAAQELHQLTGQTLGYRFDQERRDRDEAARRWKSWWESKGRQRFQSGSS